MIVLDFSAKYNDEHVISFGDVYVILSGLVISTGRLDVPITLNLFNSENLLINTVTKSAGEKYEFTVKSGKYYMICDNGCSLKLIDNIKV